MVLADGGLCCIDEFDGIRTEDMSALNEPMEQQTLSIAKAGITTKLHTRTTIFAVTNPKARMSLQWRGTCTTGTYVVAVPPQCNDAQLHRVLTTRGIPLPSTLRCLARC